MDISVLDMIKEINTHIGTLNDDYTKLNMNVAVLQSQMESIIWWTRTVVGAFVLLLITQFWQIVLIKKGNGKK